MKMFNAQFEKEMRAEGRKNRKMVEKVIFLMLKARTQSVGSGGPRKL